MCCSPDADERNPLTDNPVSPAPPPDNPGEEPEKENNGLTWDEMRKRTRGFKEESYSYNLETNRWEKDPEDGPHIIRKYRIRNIPKRHGWLRVAALFILIAVVSALLFRSWHLAGFADGKKMIDVSYSIADNLHCVDFYDSNGNRAARLLESNKWGKDRISVTRSGPDDDTYMKCIYTDGILWLREEYWGEDYRIVYYDIQTGLPETMEETIGGRTRKYTFRQEVKEETDFTPELLADYSF